MAAIASGAPGAIDATGTASHWALVDTGNSRLFAAGALSASQAVTDGNTFTLSAFDIGIPRGLSLPNLEATRARADP